MQFEDRRTYERFQLKLPLNCSQENSSEQSNFCAHDISAEGMGVISDKELSPGAEVSMSLHLPSSNKALSAQGKVIWSERLEDGFRVGINLEQSGLMEVSTILRFLRAKSA
jgi:hypothetical protein